MELITPIFMAAAEEIDGIAVRMAINNRIADFFIVVFSSDMAFVSTAEIPYVVLAHPAFLPLADMVGGAKHSILALQFMNSVTL